MLRRDGGDIRSKPIRVGVNVSRHQLIAPGFVDSVTAILRKYELSGSCLCFEVTESNFIKGSPSVVEALAQLRSLGIQIYLDDFGTGYSSLNCLHRYPIDMLKIDQSLISGAAENREVIVGALIVMCKAMGISVIAEGIEDPVQLEMLQR